MADELLRRYRGRVVFGPFVAVDPAELTALESALGGQLPSAYRAFLDAAHGGSLGYSIRMPADAGGEIISFDEFYRIGRNEDGEYGHGTLLGEYRSWAEGGWAERVPARHLLPIARDGGGDTLCLDLGAGTPDRLVAFVYGLPAWTGLNQQNVMAVVADDFDGYLDSLFIDADSAEVTWEDVRDMSPADPWRRAVEVWLDEGLPGWRDRPWAAEGD